MVGQNALCGLNLVNGEDAALNRVVGSQLVVGHVRLATLGKSRQQVGPVPATLHIADDPDRALCCSECGADSNPGILLATRCFVNDSPIHILAIQAVGIVGTLEPDARTVVKLDPEVTLMRVPNALVRVGLLQQVLHADEPDVLGLRVDGRDPPVGPAWTVVPCKLEHPHQAPGGLAALGAGLDHHNPGRVADGLILLLVWGRKFECWPHCVNHTGGISCA